VLTEALETAVGTLGAFDRVSVGFPGAVKAGRIITAPNLGTELWTGFDLQSALAARWKKPVRVMNDADVQGFGAITGKGVEMVLTLGTGAGTSLFLDGRISPHLELAHHPIHGDKTYDEYVGNAALKKIGKKKWNKRVAKVIGILRVLTNFDHLYLGGGNAQAISFELPADITIVPNSDGLTGGIALWGGTAPTVQPPEPARPARTPRPAPLPKSGPHSLTLTAAQPSTAVSFEVPAGACDCHVHVFGTADAFPFVEKRSYTPPPASAEQLLALQNALHLSRVVIVQPSVYGTDNSCTIDGIRRLGDRARGVAVIDDNTANDALDEMHKAGIRGVRVNLETAGETDPDLARRNLIAAAERVAPRGWHVQVYTRLSVLSSLRATIEAGLPVPVVFDHFGGARAADGLDQPGFADLVALVKAGHAYVKVSGSYRSSDKPPAYADTAPLAKALIAANPDRVVWGTDWPHPNHALPGRPVEETAPLFDIDDGLALNQLYSWAQRAIIRRKILVDNPARLYDF
jgi:predicted TIM-barrel fold metal-dependent hydrolase